MWCLPPQVPLRSFDKIDGLVWANCNAWVSRVAGMSVVVHTVDCTAKVHKATSRLQKNNIAIDPFTPKLKKYILPTF